jgi:hypothetical protein
MSFSEKVVQQGVVEQDGDKSDAEENGEEIREIEEEVEEEKNAKEEVLDNTTTCTQAFVLKAPCPLFTEWCEKKKRGGVGMKKAEQVGYIRVRSRRGRTSTTFSPLDHVSWMSKRARIESKGERTNWCLFRRRRFEQGVELVAEACNSWEIKPVESDDYVHEVIAATGQKASLKRGLKILPRLPSSTKMAAPASGPAFVVVDRKQESERKAQAMMTARLPESDLRYKLIDLFSANGGVPMTASDLQQLTGQKETYLRDVLGKIAFFNNSGEHRQKWELRDQYKL